MLPILIITTSRFVANEGHFFCSCNANSQPFFCTLMTLSLVVHSTPFRICFYSRFAVISVGRCCTGPGKDNYVRGDFRLRLGFCSYSCGCSCSCDLNCNVSSICTCSFGCICNCSCSCSQTCSCRCNGFSELPTYRNSYSNIFDLAQVAFESAQ